MQRLHILNCDLEPSAHSCCRGQHPAGFRGYLDNDVKPLTAFKLKVRQEHLVRAGISVLIMGRSGRNRKMRQERKISRDPPGSMLIMQRTQSRDSSRHLKKYHLRQYAHSTDISQSPQDVPNKRFGGKVSALFRGWREDLREPEPAKSEESIADIVHGFPTWFTELTL